MYVPDFGRKTTLTSHVCAVQVRRSDVLAVSETRGPIQPKDARQSTQVFWFRHNHKHCPMASRTATSQPDQNRRTKVAETVSGTGNRILGLRDNVSMRLLTSVTIGDRLPSIRLFG